MYEPNNYQNLTSSYKRRSLLRPCSVDRLTSLPNDILTRILSRLPTKAAATTQVVSKRMKQQAFCWISSIHLDNSQVSHCIDHPNLIEKFSLFKSFTENLLIKLSEYRRPLTRFKLYLDGFKTVAGPTRFHPADHKCLPYCCSPDLEPARLYAWISFPLAHSGLRELDLRFHVREPDQCTLPHRLFACQSLAVLRLDSNLEINCVVDVCLPNLKILHLYSLVLTKDEFVTRLVSNCPILEELDVTFCLWMKADRLIIISNSLRRLTFLIRKEDYCKESEVLIDTPNLEFISYKDNFPWKCSIPPMNSLVKACFCPDTADEDLNYFHINLIFLSAVFNVQHLALHTQSLQTFMSAGELKNQLPMFRNLITLKLSALRNVFCHGVRWDIVLLMILHRSPMLETIVFSEGFFGHHYDECVVSGGEGSEIAALEAEGWRTATNIPSCFRSHLRKIVINTPCGCDRELNMMKFLLGNASVLKELVICESKSYYVYSEGIRFDGRQFKKTVEELPKASNSCSIIYCDDDESTFFRNLNWFVI